jgi:3-oxoacyl-[acyl-carrier protein] reductase
MPTLENKIAIVTGGSKGIGRATTQALLKDGASVVVCSRNEREIKECVAHLRQKAGERIQGIACDVRDYNQVQRLVEFTQKHFAAIDILINNAAVGIFGSVADISPEQWRQVIDTNLTGVYHCCHAVIPFLKKRGGGYIINISSLAGKNPFKDGSAYNASKFGLNGFSEAIMQDLRYDNIRVSYIMPGSVNTRFGGHEEEAANSWKLAPSDVAQIVVDLLHHDPRCLPSCVEVRPSRPVKK